MKTKLTLLVVVCLLNFGIAKSQAISSAAGNGINGFSGDGGPANNAEFSHPIGVAFDSQGNAYIADANNNRIRKIDTQGIVTTVAGTGAKGYSGDGAKASSAQLNFPSGIVCDERSNLYFADEGNNVVRKINSEGIISTIAGKGSEGFSGDGGSALKAELDQPMCVALDANGNVFIADYGNNRIRKINTAGIITTIAGNGTAGFAGNGGPGNIAMLDGPVSIVCDAAGNVYIADENNNCVRKVNKAGIISTFAGNGDQDYKGDGGTALSASFFWPAGLAFDKQGNLYIADEGNAVIRKIDEKGIVNTFNGNEKVKLADPAAIAFDPSGNMYVADETTSMICRNFKH